MRHLLILIILVLCVPVYSAEFLIYNTEHWTEALSQEQLNKYAKKYPKHFMDKYNARYQRGDVVEVRPDGYWTGRKAPGYDKSVFLMVTKPGLKFEDAKKYGTSLKDISGKIIKIRKYNFTNVTDEQVINNLSEITITEKRSISAKETISYIALLVGYLLKLLFC